MTLFLIPLLVLALDADQDGLSDSLEAELIEKFRPQFLLDTEECAGRPAAFVPSSVTPAVEAQNGTIYARVSPFVLAEAHVYAAEVHYYHLWERDCGAMNPHHLDVEHVSVLVSAASRDAPAEAWRARYWYAAAHESTVCDTSNAARAEVLRAVDRGARVWISSGKHASYLVPELCRQRGCGGDRCENMTPLPPGALINIGEADHPLAGAVWTASPEWPFREKLGSDFDAELIAALDRTDDRVVARANGDWRTTHVALSIGGDVIGAAGAVGRHGGSAVESAQRETGSAIGRAFRAVGRALFGAKKSDAP